MLDKNLQIFICKKSKLKKENVKTERRLTFEFLRQESRQRYSFRDSISKCHETSGANLNSRKLYSRVLNNFAEHFPLFDLYFMICFSLFGQSDKKNKKIVCPVYLLFTEKVNFFLVNKEKNSQLNLVLRS